MPRGTPQYRHFVPTSRWMSAPTGGSQGERPAPGPFGCEWRRPEGVGGRRACSPRAALLDGVGPPGRPRVLRRGPQADVGVVLERLRDRALGLAQRALRGARRAAASGRPSASTMNRCASGESSKPPRSHAAQTTPPAAPEKPDQALRLAAARAGGELGGEPGRQRQLEAEGERRGRPGGAIPRAVAARRLLAVEQRQVAAEQVVGGRVRPPRSRAAAAPRRSRAPPPSAPARSSAGCGWRGDGMRRGDRGQLAPPLVEDEVEPEERLQPPAEARARPPRPLGDRADPPARRRCRGEGRGPPRRSGCCAGRPPRSCSSPA